MLVLPGITAPARLRRAATRESDATGPSPVSAALPYAVGLTGDDYDNPVAFNDGYQMAMAVCAVLLVMGGVFGWIGLRGSAKELAAQPA